MTRIDIDLLRYGSRGADYRVNNDSRMLIAESRVPACEAARGAAGRESYANDRVFSTRSPTTPPGNRPLGHDDEEPSLTTRPGLKRRERAMVMPTAPEGPAPTSGSTRTSASAWKRTNRDR